MALSLGKSATLRHKAGGGKGFGQKESGDPTAQGKPLVPVDPRRDPTLAETVNTKCLEAVGLLKEGKLKKAEKHYLKLIKAGTINKGVYLNLAVIYGLEHQFVQMRQWLELALKIDGNNPSVHNNLGVAKRELGDFSAAVGSFRQAHALDPENINIHLNLASALGEVGALAESVELY